MTDTPADGEHPRPRGANGQYARSLDSIDRDRTAAGLIVKGWSYAEVADYLNYSDKQACHRAVRRVRAEAAQLDPGIAELRRDQITEMTALARRCWDDIESPAPLVDRLGRVCHDDNGDPIPDAQAIAANKALLVKINARIAAIKGSDPPKTRVNIAANVSVRDLVDIFENMHPDDFHEAIAEYQRRIRAGQITKYTPGQIEP